MISFVTEIELATSPAFRMEVVFIVIFVGWLVLVLLWLNFVGVKVICFSYIILHDFQVFDVKRLKRVRLLLRFGAEITIGRSNFKEL